MFKTAYGQEIKIGSILQSSKFPNADHVQCTGIEGDEVLLSHSNRDEIPVRLTQDNLDRSLWSVIGFKQIGGGS